MKKAFLLLITVLFFGLLQAQESIDLKQVNDYMNKDIEVVVEAKISQIKQFDRVAYLNLGGVYPRQKLNLVVLENEFETFESLLSAENRGKRIKVQGYITDYKDNNRPQILLKKLSQVEILE